MLMEANARRLLAMVRHAALMASLSNGKETGRLYSLASTFCESASLDRDMRKGIAAAMHSFGSVCRPELSRRDQMRIPSSSELAD